MDAEEKFKKELMHRQKKDMHVKFFKQDPSRQFIKVPIFSKLSSKKQIIPFRNIECLQPSCVYDLEDLLEKFKNAQMNTLHGFICYSCNTFIELQNFHLDYTLRKMIDTIYEKYNKPNKIICKAVTIMRDGHWEPNLPEYLKYLEKNQAKRKDQDQTSFQVKGADDEQMTTMIEYENPPSLRDYDKNELKELHSAFVAAKLPNSSVYLNKDGIPVTAFDIKKLEQEETISERIVALFTNYLNQLQKIEKDKYNKNFKNRCYFLALNVINFDKYYKKVHFEYFFGFKNNYKKDLAKIHQDYEKVAFLMKYDDRWICAIVDLVMNRYFIADFLSEDLSKVKYEEVLEVVKYLAQSEFKIKYDNHEFYDQQKLNFISDCGMYALNYAYKCLNNPSLDTLRVKFSEKDLFRKQLLWIILKMRSLKKREVQFFGFPGGKDENQSKPKTKNKKDPVPDLLKFLDDDDDGPLSPIPKVNRQKSNFSSLSKSQSTVNVQNAGFTFSPRTSVKSTKPLENRKNNQDSMIELDKNQLEELLKDFKKEVQEKIKNQKKKAKKKKTKKKDGSSSSGSEDSSEDQSISKYKKKKKKDDSSGSSDDDDDDGSSDDSSDDDSSDDSSNSRGKKSANNNLLPSIYKNGYSPNYGKNPLNLYGFNPYQNNMYSNPYGFGGTKSVSSSQMSSRSGNSKVSGDDSSIASIKKGKSKDYGKPDNDDGLFNYARNSTSKKGGLGSKSKGRKGKRLDSIDEDTDESF